VNDAFLAGVLGAFRRYHEHYSVPIDLMPIGIPVSLRTSDDPMGGNRFAGARFAAPVGEADPRARIEIIREFVLTARAEPAIGFLDLVAPTLSRLPTAAIIELAAGMTNVSDVQASNIPGMGHPVYLAGARVTGLYPLGPRPGVAAMIAMISYDGTCCIGLNVDPAVHVEVIDGAPAIPAEHAARMRVVDHHDAAEFLRDGAEVVQRAQIAVHAEDGFGDDRSADAFDF